MASKLDNRIRHHGLRPVRPPASMRIPRYSPGAATGRHRSPETREIGRRPAALTGIRSLLVPLDGSPFGEHALPLAATIARRAGAELRVLHVHTRPGPDDPPVRHYYPDGPYGPSRVSRSAYLDDVAGRLARATAVKAKPQVCDGWDVAAELRPAAADADLVVMATHARGPLGRLWHGSITHDLMDHVRTPLLLVKGGEALPALGAEPAVGRVLVPFDGTAVAEDVLGPAADLAALLGAEVMLLATLPFRFYGEADRSGGLPRLTDPWLPRVVYDALESCAERLAARGLEVETRVVFDDRSVAAVAREFANRRPAEVVAVTRRPGGLRRLLFGSMADRVLRGASAAVLVAGSDAVNSAVIP